jgi:spermidine dehydrogenase
MPSITRRDFLNGFAVSIAAGLGPLRTTDVAAAPRGPYPPGLSGLRGSTDQAFAVIHGLVREGRSYDVSGVEPEERYDLVVVGAGLAGLTAAWSFKRQHRSARILILDNHDDFGGHARRCEFEVDGGVILGYGGSESMVSPRSKYKGSLKRVLSEIGINPEMFYDEDVFHRGLYPGLKLSRGVFFPKEVFGADRLVTGDPMVLSFDELIPATRRARTIEAFLGDCPLSAEARAGVVELFRGSRDYLAGLNTDEKLARLRKLSYRSFLVDVCRLPKEGADFFQGRSNDNFGLGIDAIPASDAMAGGFPGAKALGLEKPLKDEEGGDEPYIHHFPDGNATIARALVRALIPAVGGGRSVRELVSRRFDYEALDRETAPVRLRLGATAVMVRNAPSGADIAYVQRDRLRRVAAGRAIVATYGAVMPFICPDIDAARARLLRDIVKLPIVYTKVVLANWKPFIAAGVHTIAAPMSFHSTVKLDYPVSVGTYRFPRTPDRPIGLQLVHVPLTPNQGHDARTQARLGRQRLMEMPFSEFEARIREDLSRMLAGTGFDHGRDIRAITVNRWAHGYAYYPNSLYDDVEAMTNSKPLLSAPIGAIAFANSDTGLDAYAHVAMSEGMRAAGEVGSRRQ